MKKALFAAAMATLALAGCRREDIREFTVDVPNLGPENAAEVKMAFVTIDKQDPRKGRVCEGIDIDGRKCDIGGTKILVRYDSMKIARTNIRMLLRDKGFDVVFPTNETGVAGYLNARPEPLRR